jgi:hypothetical protein
MNVTGTRKTDALTETGRMLVRLICSTANKQQRLTEGDILYTGPGDNETQVKALI